MSREELYNKQKELLSRHEGLKEMYFDDPTFRRCIDALVNGQDEVRVIAELCSIVKKQNIKMEEYLSTHPNGFLYKLE